MVSSGGRLATYRTGGAGFAIPPVAASQLPRFTTFGRLSFNTGGGGVLGGEAVETGTRAVPGRAGALSLVSQRTPGLPEISRRVGPTGNVKIACLAPLVALR